MRNKQQHWTQKDPEAQGASRTPSVGRRRWLGLGLASAVATLGGCNWQDVFHSGSESPSVSAPPEAVAAPGAGGGTPTTPPTATPSTAPWIPNPSFVQGSQLPFDLAATLPTDVARGGVFSVDPAGAPLPAGMTMTANGLLFAGAANVGTSAGVVFRYTEPS